MWAPFCEYYTINVEIDHEATAKLKEDKVNENILNYASGLNDSITGISVQTTNKVKTYNLIEVMNSDEGTEFECCDGFKYFVENGFLCMSNNIITGHVGSNIKLANAQFTLVQPKIKLSDDEKIILRNLDPEYKWIAVDADGMFVSKSNPEIYNSVSKTRFGADGIRMFDFYPKHFASLTFENSPHLIADLIKE